jgi:hypothetical protein
LALTVILTLLLLWQWRIAWKRDAVVLVPIAIFTLAVTNLIGITTAASNYIALLPGLILLMAYWRRDGGPFPDWPAVMTMALLFVGLWFLFWTSRSGRAQSPVMLFPLPLLLIISLPIVNRAAARSKSNS